MKKIYLNYILLFYEIIINEFNLKKQIFLFNFDFRNLVYLEFE